MPNQITLGSVTAAPGTIQYGRWDAFQHPTGHTEFLPVIIAQGRQAGPCMWLTAGIHGPEQAGPPVIYRLLTQDLVDQLRGTIVAIPALSPAGLRTMKRAPYHAPEDPNRLWPDGKPEKPQDPDKKAPSSLETAYGRLYKEMDASANLMIDYHNAWTGSIPFSIRDRILYREDGDIEAAKREAEALAARVDEMLSAFGMTIVNEFPSEKYIDEKLHRSTSGVALLLSRIPAFTAELGGGEMPDTAIIQAAVAGTRNVMRWAGMLDGEFESIEDIPVIDAGFAAHRRGTPRTPNAGVVLHLVQPGDLISAGDPVAEIRDVWGRPVGEGLLCAEDDGFVLSRAPGVFFYPGDAVTYMAVRDEAPRTGPYPKTYFDD